MHRSTILAVFAAIFLSLTASIALADDATKTAEKPVTNKACPISGEPTNPKLRAEYQGQYVYFCCPDCLGKFKENPEAAIAKLSAEDKAAIEKNTTCPVSGETITSFNLKSEYNGKLVYFCCDHCKAKFDKEHPAT